MFPSVGSQIKLPTPQVIFSESDGYERLMGRWSRRLPPLFLEFAEVTEGCVVLDERCGIGALTFAAVNTGSASGNWHRFQRGPRPPRPRVRDRLPRSL